MDGQSYIPPEVLYDVLVRLPVKSLCRFKCVSKVWNSIISDPGFVDAQFDRSSVSSQTLLICVYDRCAARSTVFYASSHYSKHSNGEDWQPRFVAHEAPYHASWTQKFDVQCVGGLVCLLFKWFDNIKLEIYNSSTRAPVADVTPPRVKDADYYVGSFFGYDPVGGTHKILVVRTSRTANRITNKFDVLTVDSRKEWRTITFHGPAYLNAGNSVCVKGVLYYLASTDDSSIPARLWLVAFDVRAEAFQMFEIVMRSDRFLDVRHKKRLMEFSGNLAVCADLNDKILLRVFEPSNGCRRVGNFMKISMPPSWKQITMGQDLTLEGITPTGELMFRQTWPSSPFWLFFYDLRSKRVRRMQVPGVSERMLAANKDRPLSSSGAVAVAFASHMESLRSLKHAS